MVHCSQHQPLLGNKFKLDSVHADHASQRFYDSRLLLTLLAPWRESHMPVTECAARTTSLQKCSKQPTIKSEMKWSGEKVRGWSQRWWLSETENQKGLDLHARECKEEMTGSEPRQVGAKTKFKANLRNGLFTEVGMFTWSAGTST